MLFQDVISKCTSSNSKYEIIGNTDISDVGQTVTGAIANIVTSPLADPDMFSSTGWTELSWDTSFVNQHKGGYKVKGNYIYINCHVLPKTGPGDAVDLSRVGTLPANYSPIDISETYAICAGNRYPAVAMIYYNSNYYYLTLNGMLSTASWTHLIAFYKYR